jgi:hypothetical protein
MTEPYASKIVLGNANDVANYHEYYQTLIENGTANEAASNAILTHLMSLLKPNANL